MKRQIVHQSIFALTAVAVVLAVGTIATLEKPAPEEPQREIIINQTVVPEETVIPEETSPPVENSVEIVETTYTETHPVKPPHSETTPVETSVLEEPSYTEQELEILAIIIYQEAGGDNCSDDTRLKVGSVFLNRVESPLFPNTFEGVATQESQYGALHWTGIKWPERASYEQEAHAVERAYRIAEELLTNGSILPINVIWQAEFSQGEGIFCYQDDIYFCYSEVSE